MCFSSFKLQRCEHCKSVTTTTSISDTYSNVLWIWMSFRAAFTCQVSKQLKNKPANVFFCLQWEQGFGHLISLEQAHWLSIDWQSADRDDFYLRVKGDTTGRAVKCCLLTILDIILQDGNDPSSIALATYLHLFIVPF